MFHIQNSLEFGQDQKSKFLSQESGARTQESQNLGRRVLIRYDIILYDVIISEFHFNSICINVQKEKIEVIALDKHKAFQLSLSTASWSDPFLWKIIMQ